MHYLLEASAISKDVGSGDRRAYSVREDDRKNDVIKTRGTRFYVYDRTFSDDKPSMKVVEVKSPIFSSQCIITILENLYQYNIDLP